MHTPPNFENPGINGTQVQETICVEEHRQSLQKVAELYPDQTSMKSAMNQADRGTLSVPKNTTLNGASINFD